MGDDLLDGHDDENGITFLTPLVPGTTATVRVVAPSLGTLDAWLDFDRDGIWGLLTDRIFDHQTLTAPVSYFTISVPAWAQPGKTFARFRLSEDGVSSFDGPARNGEVEDYRVRIRHIGGGAHPPILPQPAPAPINPIELPPVHRRTGTGYGMTTDLQPVIRRMDHDLPHMADRIPVKPRSAAHAMDAAHDLGSDGVGPRDWACAVDSVMERWSPQEDHFANWPKPAVPEHSLGGFDLGYLGGGNIPL
jgi:hypothetical protein